MKTGSLLAFIVCILVAVAHLVRLFYGAEVSVAGTVIPQWASVVGFILPALIAFLLWRERRA